MATSVQRLGKDHLMPWKMLALLVGLQVLVAFVGRSLAPLGPLIGVDLSLTKAQIGLMPAALFVGQSVIALPAGFLTDRIGTKWMLLIAAVCLGGSFMVMTFVSVYAGMLLMIVLGGVGYGASHPAANRGILYWFDAKKRGTAMGIKQMGITAGSALSALLLLPLANVWGWRPAVILASVLLVIVGLAVFMLFRDPEGWQRRNLQLNRHVFLVDWLRWRKTERSF
ncbi:putative 4-methylmuconolactone transporter [Lentibacillus sp. JNUCC-1]|uniref:MFS transporter n=1 Tax=Lentibacillus sp. JNUCC-1 TaxID=2654513 RepID=UPI00132AD2BC|nr:MFS transporter [Lentibacillus sp. JNUCC-1]MUV37206.1 putative 4-methylmuconolactone transporter [Lentibacillus sp. JNUCC-1]